MPRTWGVYLVTDRTQTAGRPLLDVVSAALDGGIRAVQLRERDLPARQLLRVAEHMRALTWRYRAALLINDRVDIALACDADGVHLPAASFAVSDARALLGARRLIGASVHAPGELAAATGADFAVIGPIYETPSKQAYGAPLGIGELRAARAVTQMPLFAIGGVDARRVAEVRAAGSDGIAVIRAVLAAADPARAASELISLNRSFTTEARRHGEC